MRFGLGVPASQLTGSDLQAYNYLTPAGKILYAKATPAAQAGMLQMSAYWNSPAGKAQAAAVKAVQQSGMVPVYTPGSKVVAVPQSAFGPQPVVVAPVVVVKPAPATTKPAPVPTKSIASTPTLTVAPGPAKSTPTPSAPIENTPTTATVTTSSALSDIFSSMPWYVWAGAAVVVLLLVSKKGKR